MFVKVYLNDFDAKPIYYHNIVDVTAGDHHLRLIDDDDNEIIIRHSEVDYHFITVSTEE